MKRTYESADNGAVDRRRFLMTLGACAIGPSFGFSPMQLAATMSASLTKEQRDSMTPSQVIDVTQNVRAISLELQAESLL